MEDRSSKPSRPHQKLQDKADPDYRPISEADGKRLIAAIDQNRKKGPGNKTVNRGNGRPDINQIAFRVVQEATGQIPKTEPPPEKNPAAVTLGRLGGLKGGKARAEKLTPEQKKAIAKKAAEARWKSEP